MQKNMFLLLILSLVFNLACNKTEVEKNPKDYNLSKPETFVLPQALKEISGIAFQNGNADTIYAEQDEEGKLFYGQWGDKQIKQAQFGPPGDYEDLAISNGYAILLRSDGVLLTMPLNEVKNGNQSYVKTLNGLLPQGEYEGLAADEINNQLYVLCKKCLDINTSTTAKGYIFQMTPSVEMRNMGSFTIDVNTITALSGVQNIKFHPSALAKNKSRNEWYILSSVNKMLVITDAAWKVKEVYKLNPSVFSQPEGIAFDSDNNLYISNERGDATNGTILRFKYLKK